MTINCHTILENKRLEPCDYKTAIESIGQKNISVLIESKGANTSELEQILGDLNVHGMIRRFCMESKNHPGYYPLHPHSLLIIPVISETKEARKLEYLGILYGNGVLLTFYEKEFSRFQKDISGEDFASVLPDSSISGVISSLLLGLSMVLLKKTAFINDSILFQEEKMDLQPEEVNIEDIADLQSDILLLESVVQGQLPVFQTYAASDKPSLNPEKVREYQILSAANLQSADRTLELLERRLHAIRSFYDSKAGEKTNRRLQRLTILSTIFMPITFLVGIWGMNFEYIPLLNNSNGYAYAVTFMVLISASMYLYFRNKGWFD